MLAVERHEAAEKSKTASSAAPEQPVASTASAHAFDVDVASVAADASGRQRLVPSAPGGHHGVGRRVLRQTDVCMDRVDPAKIDSIKVSETWVAGDRKFG